MWQDTKARNPGTFNKYIYSLNLAGVALLKGTQKVDAGGYGVSWNDGLDLDAEDSCKVKGYGRHGTKTAARNYWNIPRGHQ